jgi:hypothetical protein
MSIMPLSNLLNNSKLILFSFLFSYGATAPNGALAYLHETLCFTSVFLILDRG